MTKQSESKRIQRQHVRRYDTGKIALVNKGVPAHSTLTVGPRFPRIQPAAKPVEDTPKPQIVPLRAREGATGPSDKWVEHTVAALQFPMISYPGQEEAFPAMLKERIPTARLAQLMLSVQGRTKEPFDEYATDEEVLAYLSTASYVAPMDYNFADIMQYVFTKVMGDKATPDVKMTTLDEYKMGMLKDLKRWIRKQQWQAWKAKMKEESK